MTELQKKYDDCKRAYIDVKANYSKAKEDIEKLKNPGAHTESSEKEIAHKYESLKLKYRVSWFNHQKAYWNI